MYPEPWAFRSEAGCIGARRRPSHREFDPVAIWLFGSRATGSNAPDSDFDLLVVTKDEDGAAGVRYDRAMLLRASAWDAK